MILFIGDDFSLYNAHYRRPSMQHQAEADGNVEPRQAGLNSSTYGTSQDMCFEHQSDVSAKIAVKMEALMRSVEEKKRIIDARQEKLLQAHDYVLDLLRLGYTFTQIKNEGAIHEEFLTELFELLNIPITEKYTPDPHAVPENAAVRPCMARTFSNCDLSVADGTFATDHREVPVKDDLKNPDQNDTGTASTQQLQDNEDYASLSSDVSKSSQSLCTSMRSQSASDSMMNSLTNQFREPQNSPVSSDRAAFELHRVLTKFQIDLRCVKILASGETSMPSAELRQRIGMRYQDILLQLDGILDQLGILASPGGKAGTRAQVTPAANILLKDVEKVNPAPAVPARSIVGKSKKTLHGAISHQGTANRSPQSHIRLPDKEEPRQDLIEDSFVRIKKHKPQMFTPYQSLLSSYTQFIPVPFATGTEDMLCPVETLNGGCEDPKCPYTHFQGLTAKD
ncbi:ABR208Wp [Eremothecium gossypii ATCC 10895]|uniref:ABR208Wp n=1 Tax=Eremothecium gossypii (strain ATCC 10895 / CBS 109.51 / FGSC 9923 / NRRL Y-1056) TaxID=284811 RepID=Q75D14_EREGS|nr:ABR208Wp [Eremothecium gossypii ATCC 10895]AAS50981.1 ABR208Wp [Eremothecium gossypii ATCC 10895]